MPVASRPRPKPRPKRGRLGTRLLRPAAATAGARTAPTFPASTDLAEGTGTRSFSAVTTAAGDYLVVECIGADGNITGFTPTCAGLTFTKRTDNAASTSDVAIEQWTAPDAGGGSRTVQVAITGSGSYRARVTVVRGSDGPGTGLATSLTGQTVSVTRQADNSAIFMTVGDWSTGAVGSPAWTPGGATVASQQGTGATYLFGRWDDSGAAGTASHGISSPSYTTPSIAVLEMLGTAAGGTNAPAEVATGTGAADDPAADIAANADVATGSGSAPDSTAAVAVNVEAATGTGTSPDPTVSTANSTSAPAEAATGTGSAPDASAALTIGADVAAGTGSAPDGSASAGIPGGAATGSGASLDAQAAVTAGAEAAGGTGAAFDATVSTASIANAPADVATGSGAAPDPSTAVTVTAEAATGSGTSFSPVGGPSGNAGAASGTGTALDTSIALTASADVATGAGAALDPVGSGSSPGQALAQVATGTGAAYDARTRKLILRPLSGTTARPDTGRTSRPGTGVTLRP